MEVEDGSRKVFFYFSLGLLFSRDWVGWCFLGWLERVGREGEGEFVVR